jgi:hypothetical protein
MNRHPKQPTILSEEERKRKDSLGRAVIQFVMGRFTGLLDRINAKLNNFGRYPKETGGLHRACYSGGENGIAAVHERFGVPKGLHDHWS